MMMIVKGRLRELETRRTSTSEKKTKAEEDLRNPLSCECMSRGRSYKLSRSFRAVDYTATALHGTECKADIDQQGVSGKGHVFQRYWSRTEDGCTGEMQNEIPRPAEYMRIELIAK